MSAKRLSPLFNWRGAIAASDLAPNARLVALVLSLHMNDIGGSCFPAQATLAAETGLAERTVRYQLAALRESGWLTVQHRPSRHGMKCYYTAEVPLEASLRWAEMPLDNVDDLF